MDAVIARIYQSLVFQSLAVIRGCINQLLSHNAHVNPRKMLGISFSKQVVNGGQGVCYWHGFSLTEEAHVMASPLLGGAAPTVMVLVCTDF